MMQEIQTLFPHDFYIKHLSILRNVHFTAREIDVIACIISARRTSKIASFLSINPRTVETHIRNIMLKLECNSQEGIIDFIENSDKLSLLRKYYVLLQLKKAFEKILNTVSTFRQEKIPLCFLISENDKDFFIVQLKEHLKQAGIRLVTSARKAEADNTLVVLPKNGPEEDFSTLLQKGNKSQNKVIFLLLDKIHDIEINKKNLSYDVVDFSKQKNYYFSFFDLLKKLIPTFNFDKILSDFKEKYKNVSFETKSLHHSSDEKKLEKRNQKRIGFLIFFMGFSIIFVGSCFLIFLDHQKETKSTMLRSDLVLPKKSILLDRFELLGEIEKKLNEKEGIQTVALVGVGGAGKTTVARLYAQTQKMNSIWEINAETPESLHESFEKLAHVLARTEIDQKGLKEILEMRDPIEKEDGMIQFVKERLRSQSNWLLLYDNVVAFADIQNYFPHDSMTWGSGKVILTTRDANIENNEHVNHAIFIGELNPQQKFTLFTKIMTQDCTKKNTNVCNEKTRAFLEKIPSFPLDVSIAAYYLKATNVPYDTYLKNLAYFDKDFTNVQESILRETGEYSRVRYGIITSSLRKILETNSEFEELLLFMMMLNPQEIPRDLLNNLKGDVLVSHFIFNLKKYSLLTGESSTPRAFNSAVSIHRSTQAIGLSYLFQKFEFEKNKKMVKSISEKLINYIDQAIQEENLEKMKFLINHSDAFLKHKKLLMPEIEGIIKGQLGIICYFLGDNIKAKLYFEESLSILNKFHEKYPTRIALFTGYLGNAWRDLGDYHKAKMLIKKALSIYEKWSPQDNFKHAYFLVFLGIVERFLGNYDAAKIVFEKGQGIQKKYFPEIENYAAWVSGQLAILERELGDYEKAKNILEKSLNSFKKDRLPDHFDIAWALEHLGVVYTKLGLYEKAREALEQSLKIYAVSLPDQIGPSWILHHTESLHDSKSDENVTTLFDQLLENYRTHFHDNYIYVAYPLSKLGNLYKELGDYEKAEILLKQSLAIYQKNYGENHLASIQTLSDLGHLYFLKEKLDDSEDLLKKSLKILEQNHHSERYICLERLSELFLKRSKIEMEKGYKENAQNFKEQALSFLKKALEVAKAQFGKGSPHVIRLEEKLKNFE
ncbi:MAG: tetratricopeptide repeat protein [Proteobacteria bacterium]|nr:tetratricopeptide repeat protein [Pseudomonadota bacterium]